MVGNTVVRCAQELKPSSSSGTAPTQKWMAIVMAYLVKTIQDFRFLRCGRSNQTVNRTPKAYRLWFPPLSLRRRLPQRYAPKSFSH